MSITATIGTGVRRIAGQGALITGAFIASQAASFVRNAILGHWLSKGDFGVAALITLMLQMVEILSDLAADRLILQDRDGDAPHLMATLHVVQIARGVLLAAVLVASGHLIARFFDVPQAAWALQILALVPLTKAFLHLDVRRRQRHVDNLGFAVVEAVPQLVALALTVPALLIWPSFAVVVWLALGQAIAAVGLSHVLATRPYRLSIDWEVVSRLLRFSWPIWLSAIPLVAVYQGDRLIVGHYLGIEALAGYSAVFMLAMVPGLLAAKVGQSLMMPLLAEVLESPDRLRARYQVMVVMIVGWAAVYLVGFVVAGGALTEIAFGDNYKGLGAVAGWLGLMWAVRMVQVVPGMALMSLGDTRPLLVAGTVRALALAPAGLLAANGYGLAVVASVGVVGELASLACLAVALERKQKGLGTVLAQRTLWLALAGFGALGCSAMVGPDPWLITALMIAAVAGIIAAALIFAVERYLQLQSAQHFHIKASAAA